MPDLIPLNKAAPIRAVIGLAALLLLLLALPAPAAESRDAQSIPLVSIDQALAGWKLYDGWRFHVGDDPAWADPGFDDSQWQRVDLSHRWYPSQENASLFGWYRLRLQLTGDRETNEGRLAGLGVQLGQVLNAYELYLGGKRIGGVGRLPPSTATGINYDRKQIFPVPRSALSEEGELVLAIRVWAGSEVLGEHWGVGPYNGDFQLGRYDRLLIGLVVSEMPGLLLSTLCAAFGLYHLYLYWRNRHLDSLLWFGLLALAISVYSLMLNQWRTYLGWEFLVYKKLEFGAIYLVPPLSLQTVWRLLDEEMGLGLRLYQLSFLVMGFIWLVIPGLEIHLQTLLLWQLWLLPALALTGWLVISRARRGHREARTILVGAIIFIGACLHDILLDLKTEGTGRLIPLGFFAFLMSMAVSLANRFTAILQGLEARVAERTDELEAANRLLTEAARIDPLTGLLNRRGFIAEAGSEIRRVFRTRRSFSVVLTDIDHFKSVNDRYGHATGDHVLSRVASLLSDEIRDVDKLARWGGEEFILLLPETEPEGAAVLAGKLRERIAGNLFEYDGQRLGVTMTFGVSEFRRGESLESCIARADAALYRGKGEGRDRVVLGLATGVA
ncbi:sensor domain-containing diguanylate cyclase [Parahaliea aestuarii]|nr:diguanylate cyclase [Parahaliea aestuarii]